MPTNLDDSPLYSITNDVFLVDSTGGRLSTSDATMSAAVADSAVQSQSQTVESLIEMIENPTTPSGGTDGMAYPQGLQINPDGLYLMPTNETTDGLGGLGFLLFNPTGSANYQLLSTTNLLNTNWCLGQVLFYPSGSPVNSFTPIPLTNAMTFFRVHQANPVMNIQSYQNSTEISPTNNNGQVGYFYLQNEGNQDSDVPVYYVISGTAQNGIAYSNLTGEVTVYNNVNSAYIYVYPRTNGIQPDLSIILTLKQNTNYLIDPNYAAATNTLFANPEVYPTVNGDNVQVCPNSSNDITLSGRDPNGLPLTYTITSWPSHGTLDTSGMPTVIYAPTNCYEGYDSFTFTANNGTYTSAPAIVNLNISDPVYANAPSFQTCRGTPVSVTLSGGDSCGETLTYALLSTPLYGSLSGTPPNLTYTPDGTNFTGNDSFNYIVYSGCGGDSATNTVTITVGDLDVFPNSQNVTTGTNRPVAITLSASDFGACTGNTNYYTYFTYTLISSPTNGTLSGSGADLIYTPTNGEGRDSFQFTVSDGVEAPGTIATVTIYVVAGPILTTGCDPFGPAVQLTWSLDTNVMTMWHGEGLNIQDFVVYRSANSGGPYTPVYTNTDTSQMTYIDSSNTNVGEVYYYAVNFESSESSITYESPMSNIIETSDQNPDDLLQANSFWEAVTNLSEPSNVTLLQAPFSDYYTNQPPANQYPGLYPLPNTQWPSDTTWSNYTTLLIPTNTDLSQVKYSIAIDNYCWLYVNGSNIVMQADNGYAVWSPFISFPPNVLHYGANNVGVKIQDVGGPDYFSMVVTTNTCGY